MNDLNTHVHSDVIAADADARDELNAFHDGLDSDDWLNLLDEDEDGAEMWFNLLD